MVFFIRNHYKSLLYDKTSISNYIKLMQMLAPASYKNHGPQGCWGPSWGPEGWWESIHCDWATGINIEL
jgi:hypothetical protein